MKASVTSYLLKLSILFYLIGISGVCFCQSSNSTTTVPSSNQTTSSNTSSTVTSNTSSTTNTSTTTSEFIKPKATIVQEQFDTNSSLPQAFYLPMIFLKDENQSIIDYGEMQRISDSVFIGYGSKNYVSPNLSNLSSSQNYEQLPSCEDSPTEYRPVCGSDGKVYRNLGQLYCAQRVYPDLRTLWNGPCNRQDWPMGDFDLNGIKILNPNVIIKY